MPTTRYALLTLPLAAALLAGCSYLPAPLREKVENTDGKMAAHASCRIFLSVYDRVDREGFTNAASRELGWAIEEFTPSIKEPGLRKAVTQAKSAVEKNPVQKLDVYKPVAKECRAYVK